MTEVGKAESSHHVTLADGRTVTLSWGAATDVGSVREHNEDSYAAAPPVFGVADGMGGHAAGDVASAAVATRLGELADEADEQGFTTPEAILEALRRAVVDLADSTDSGGTTVTGVGLVTHDGEQQWAIFNIGDSRVYALAEGRFEQLTNDHSIVQEMVRAGLLSEEDAENHPDSNVVTRAVGFNEEPILDVWIAPITDATRLLLCSDGLVRELTRDQMRQVLEDESAPKAAADRLVADAVDAGGRDNVTVIVLDVALSGDDSAPDSVPPKGGGA